MVCLMNTYRVSFRIFVKGGQKAAVVGLRTMVLLFMGFVVQGML